jgi:hypothetical protein
MIGTEVILSAVRREIHRTMQKLHKPSRVGLVSSYDPKQYAVKVQLQPEGTLTGWIPLTATAIGNQFGIYAAPNIKDQVEVSWQEGDQMTPRVTTRHFSQKADQPYQEVQAGEYHIIHGTGAVMRFLQDGTVQIGGGQTTKPGQTGQGQSGDYSTGNNQGQASQTQQTQQQQPQQPAAKQVLTFKPDGSVTFNVPDSNAQGQGNPHNPTWTTTVQKDIGFTSSQGNINHTAQQGNLSRSAQNGNITDTAQSIGHNGNTSVTGNLGVTQDVTALAYNNGSDRRIKRGITKLTDVLSKVLSLTFCRFDIYEPVVQDGVVSVVVGTATPSLGVIAQDVRKVVPEIVRGDESVEVLTVQESKIGVLAAAALQEYVAKTDAKIAALEARIAALEAQHEQ